MESEKVLCRTCLASGVKFFKLNAPFLWPADGDELMHSIEEHSKVTFRQSLHFCTKLDDVPEFPSFICAECCRALQIAYYFIKNAVKAHEILSQRKLSKRKRRQSSNRHDSDTEIEHDEKRDLARFRCKICQETVATKKLLKEHIKLHFDVITYCCQLCDFDCKKRSQLSSHYLNEHNIEASDDQLKPYLHPNNVSMDAVKTEIKIEFENKDKKLEHLERLRQRQQEQEVAERLLLELEEKMLKEKQEEEEKSRQNMQNTRSQLVFLNEFNDQQNSMQSFDNLNVTSSAAINPITSDNIPPAVFDNEMSIANEFIVLADGSVQKVLGTDVVIEYINQSSTHDGNIQTSQRMDSNNFMSAKLETNLDTNLELGEYKEIRENICENISSNTEKDESQIPSIFTKNEIASSLKRDTLSTSSLKMGRTLIPKKIKCKLCSHSFLTQSELKIHMLTHSEIPHFFCDRCAFYTFFKNDLVQHYKAKHNIHPSHKQLQPKNNPDAIIGKAIYSCDLCLYESSVRISLHRHYLNEHGVEATEVQLRPTIDNTDVDITISSVPKSKPSRRHSSFTDTPSSSCFQNAYDIREQQPEQQKMISKNDDVAENNKLDEKNLSKIQRSQVELGEESMDIDESLPITASLLTTTTTTMSVTTAAATSLPTIENSTEITNNSINNLNYNNIAENNSSTSNILPMDEVPQVIASEQTIIQDDIDIDFNGDEFFEDFDNVTDQTQDNDDLGDLVLTSEDDLDDLLEDNDNESHVDGENGIKRRPQQAYCIHCNKKFFSQYHFENHMFIHRGLAPYRCEMCTNLYNTKRALIRHYKAVHKKMPSRDMIQAKGDKIDNDQISTEDLNLEQKKANTLMCSKCPYESTELLNLQLHLTNSHDITDENYILQKLPFECSRCIRSFESKAKLLRHLERSHSEATIMQQRSKTSKATEYTQGSCVASEISTVITTATSSSKSTSTQNAALVDSITRSGILDQPQTSATATTLSAAASKFYVHESTTDSNILSVKDNHDNNYCTAVAAGGYEGQLSRFQCAICQRHCKSEPLLKHHMKRHLERNFVCDLCPKTFITRSNLEQHRLLHTSQLTGELPFQCEICQKQFSYKHHLKRHQDVVHLGLRFQCPMSGCDVTFTSTSQMKLHVRNHKGNLPYRCRICKRSFLKRGIFRKHMIRVHKVTLTESEVAEIFRETAGYTNPHDLVISDGHGQMLHRSDAEATSANAAIVIGDDRGENDSINENEAYNATEIITEEMCYQFSDTY